MIFHLLYEDGGSYIVQKDGDKQKALLACYVGKLGLKCNILAWDCGSVHDLEGRRENMENKMLYCSSFNVQTSYICK